MLTLGGGGGGGGVRLEVMSKRRLFARVSRVSVEVRVMAAVSARV